MGLAYDIPFPRSAGTSSFSASSFGLLVIAPKRQQSVSFNSLIVRSGRGFPSLHQNSQPMSPGMYSASSFTASRTMRAASMTSFPMPSPGSHAILNFAMSLPHSFAAARSEGALTLRDEDDRQSGVTFKS